MLKSWFPNPLGQTGPPALGCSFKEPQLESDLLVLLRRHKVAIVVNHVHAMIYEL